MNDSKLIFEKSQPARKAMAQFPKSSNSPIAIPANLLRSKPLGLPSISELEVIRHYTKLSQKNFSIDTHFYPLGSCTMKYNPRGVSKAVNHPNLLNRHPLAPVKNSQGFLQCLFELQEYLKDITGMQAVSLTPMAGSQGEFAGVAMMKRYHVDRGDLDRDEIIIPDSAHGTNPASASMCGCKVVEIATLKDGDIDIEALAAKVGPRTVGIMLTNPATTGLFSKRIEDVSAMVHAAGGLLYYDGANLNAILGKVRPGDMGFDVIHLNLHKTFATPHGGGGPGAGPVATNARLTPYLPTPMVAFQQDQYVWQTEQDIPGSIGRLSAFMGNAAILLRAYAYIRMLGREGLTRVADYATLNANYLQCELAKLGYQLAYPERRAAHEFLITLQKERDETGVTAKDVGKRLLDYGFHAPTTYFPLLVPECLLIEPTETESKQTLDAFLAAMAAIRKEIFNDPQLVKTAPHTLPVKRLNDVKAARELDLIYVDPHANT